MTVRALLLVMLFCSVSVAEVGGAESIVRQQFLAGSRPLMKYCNMLSFNLRAICLYVTALNDCPWLYFVFEITVFNLMYVYMHRTHEQLSKRLADQLA